VLSARTNPKSEIRKIYEQATLNIWGGYD